MSALQQFGKVKAEDVIVDNAGFENQQELDDQLLEGGDDSDGSGVIRGGDADPNNFPPAARHLLY